MAEQGVTPEGAVCESALCPQNSTETSPAEVQDLTGLQIQAVLLSHYLVWVLEVFTLFTVFSSLNLSASLVVVLPVETAPSLTPLPLLAPHVLFSPQPSHCQEFQEWPPLDFSYPPCACDIQPACPSLQNSGPVILWKWSTWDATRKRIS